MSMAVTAVVATAVGTGLQYYGAKKAEKASKRAGRQEARMEEAVTQERIRQLERQEEMMAGATVAGAAGSGVKTTSASVLQVLADQASEFRREREITEEVGASRAQASIQRADALATQYRYAGYSALFTGLSSTYGQGREYGLWG